MEDTNRGLKICLMLGFLATSASSGHLSAEVITGEEEQTGLRTWKWKHAGISIQLVQRLPD